MADLAGSGEPAVLQSDVIGSSDRRREINQRLDDRHRERLETQAQRRSERAADTVESEQAGHFWAALEREEAAAQAELTLPAGADRGGRRRRPGRRQPPPAERAPLHRRLCRLPAGLRAAEGAAARQAAAAAGAAATGRAGAPQEVRLPR